MSDKLYAGRKGNKNRSTAHRRSKIGSRRPPNRHSFECDSEFVSASSKKLKLDDDKCDRDVDDSFGYRFVNFVTVFTALSQVVVCKECKCEVSFSEGSRRGLDSKIIVACKNCGDNPINSCPLINDRAYEIHTRIVYAMRLLDIGINGIKKFCAFMDLPKPIFQVTYDKIVSNIAIATARVRTLCMKKAAEEEKLMSIKHDNNDGLLSTFTISGDGSWRKRAFSSLFGIITLIGWHTGKVDSWCSWQRDKTSGLPSSFTHKPPMHEDVFKAIKPIYEELSSDDLLSRCLGGYTQNTNESFNSVVWSIAPKAVLSGKTVLDIATDIAIITFNDGLSSLFPIYNALGLTVGRNLYDFCLESDENRIKAAEHSLSDIAKEARRSITSTRKELEKQNTAVEG
ncbi:hypothetical protein ALC57_12742 [Trachymyrmex cornetzi]|uniref:Mutator-like transposase domain-containing protein n=1 Tax=Trachymyrmex cornetzi TaxID=471704 RepID=A0A151J0W3_9HYME|nr:hypothetical protein ALC57_12742 [Trachymyrmex cornetzi]